MKRSPENPKSEIEKADDALATTTESSDEGSTSEKGFFNRWSQRKRDAVVSDANTDTELKDADPSTLVTPEPATLADESDTILTDADMPPVESLNADSDFSPFFSEGVSKELRNRALKKLFFSGKFSARDGLDDYDDDFTKFEPLGDTVTSDMKFHRRRKEKARLAELEAAEFEAAEAEERAAAEQEIDPVTEEPSDVETVSDDESPKLSVDDELTAVKVQQAENTEEGVKTSNDDVPA